MFSSYHEMCHFELVSSYHIPFSVSNEQVEHLLKDCLVTTASEAIDLVKEANKNRITKSTQMNEGSSRSHAICTFSILSSSADNDESSAKLTFVDLAGNEKYREETDFRLRQEGKALATDLFVLSNVMRNLADNASHISYRDSNLTMSLKDSLGGEFVYFFVLLMKSE